MLTAYVRVMVTDLVEKLRILGKPTMRRMVHHAFRETIYPYLMLTFLVSPLISLHARYYVLDDSNQRALDVGPEAMKLYKNSGGA